MNVQLASAVFSGAAALAGRNAGGHHATGANNSAATLALVVNPRHVDGGPDQPAQAPVRPVSAALVDPAPALASGSTRRSTS